MLSFQGEKFLTNLLKDVFYEHSEDSFDELQVSRILFPVLEKIKDGTFGNLNESVHFEKSFLVHQDIDDKVNDTEIVSILLCETGESGFSVEISADDEQDADVMCMCGYALNGKVKLGHYAANGVRLVLCNEESRIIGMAKTEPDGIFSIGFIGKGKYYLMVIPTA